MANTVSNPFQEFHSVLVAINDSIAKLVARDQSKDLKKYYPIAEAAKILCVSEITLYRGTEAGEIPHKKIGSRVVIPSYYIDNHFEIDGQPKP